MVWFGSHPPPQYVTSAERSRQHTIIKAREIWGQEFSGEMAFGDNRGGFVETPIRPSDVNLTSWEVRFQKPGWATWVSGPIPRDVCVHLSGFFASPEMAKCVAEVQLGTVLNRSPVLNLEQWVSAPTTVVVHLPWGQKPSPQDERNVQAAAKEAHLYQGVSMLQGDDALIRVKANKPIQGRLGLIGSAFKKYYIAVRDE